VVLLKKRGGVKVGEENALPVLAVKGRGRVFFLPEGEKRGSRNNDGGFGGRAEVMGGGLLGGGETGGGQIRWK